MVIQKIGLPLVKRTGPDGLVRQYGRSDLTKMGQDYQRYAQRYRLLSCLDSPEEKDQFFNVLRNEAWTENRFLRIKSAA